METLPIYISVVFVLTTLLTALLLYKASDNSKAILIIALLWLGLQAAAGLAGFYTVTKGTPPRFALLLIPPMVFIIIMFLTKKGRAFIDGFDIKTLTVLHIVRVPVELTLYWLFLHKAVPQVMTFEGRNFDILCGLTAPLVYYWGCVKNVISRKVILGWNIICLILVLNIVVTAVLSTPLPFQKFGFEQPNVALFYFPFIWLPCFVVPVVLLAHLAAIRQLVKENRNKPITILA